MKKMTVGKCLSAITCILGVITFILLAVYGSKGGIVQTTVYVALAALGVVSIITSVVANFLKKESNPPWGSSPSRLLPHHAVCQLPRF